MSEPEWIAAGLYDPAAPDAPERRSLLEYLEGLGLSTADITEAACGRGLGQLAAARVLWDDRGPTLTATDIAARAGMPEAMVRRIIRAAGIADPGDAPTYREAHVELFDTFAAGAAIFGEEATLQFTRVLGASAARAAEAAVSLFLANVSPRLQSSGPAALDGVRESANAVAAFGGVPTAMDLLLREHFTAAIRRLGLLDIAEGGTTAVAIAFVDLADSTDLARNVSATELTAALSAFENTAHDAAVARDCRVVKLIGDEVMLAAASATTLVRVVGDVLDVVDDHPLLGAGRAGLAAGYAVSRDGDYFGPVVNLASRLVGVARPGEVLADGAVAREIADDGYVVDDAGARALKGFDEPVPVHRLRR
jgi:class 3 adenylate cyclase